jgi:hypothetical protein
MGYVAAGATQSVTFDFTVLSGSQVPPNGSLITLVVSDRANGALISLTVAVNDSLAMLEKFARPFGKLVLADPLRKPDVLRRDFWQQPKCRFAEPGCRPIPPKSSAKSNRGLND